MGFRHYTRSEIEKAKRMYSAGIGTQAIARELGRNEQYMRRFLWRAGVTGKMQHNCAETLCWQCANSVPKIDRGKYVRGCSWSIAFEPVEGWTATRCDMLVKNMRGHYSHMLESYLVRECPEFVEG